MTGSWLRKKKNILLMALFVQAVFILVFALWSSAGVMKTAALLAAPVLLVAIIARPEFGIVMLIFTSALDAYGVLPLFAGLRISLFHVALVAVIFGWMGRKLISGSLRVHSSRIYLVLGVYLSMFLLSMVYSPAPDTALFIAVRILFLILMSFLILDLIDTKRKTLVLLSALFISAFFVALLATYQSFAGRSPDIGAMILGHLTRSQATFGDPNVMGAFLMGTIIVVTSLLINVKHKWLPLALLVVTLFTLYGGILTTFSRSAWLSTGIGTMLLLAVSKNLKALFITLCLLAVTLFVLVRFLPYGGLISARMGTLFTLGGGDVSILTRKYMSLSGLRMFAGHPLFGVGLGGFEALYPKYILPQLSATMGHVRLSHVMLITILAECGVIGISIFSWVIISVVKEGVSAIRAVRDDYLRAVALGLLVAFITYLVDFLFYSNFFDNLFWIIVGLIFAIARIGSIQMAEISAKN